MKIIATRNYEEMCRRAAALLSAQILLKPDSVLGLATGSTPIGLYDRLIQLYKEGELDFSNIRSINLDEYRGIASDNPQSYAYFMRKNLFDQVNIRLENTHIPNGLTEKPEEECAAYDSIVEQLGGIDMQLLGIGGNGHIGFNEPDTAFSKQTHLVALAQSTIDANSRFFASPEEVPTYAYTVGIQTIIRSRRVLLVANGAGKADALYAACYGPITPEVPASILQLHSDVTVVADADALSRFPKDGILS